MDKKEPEKFNRIDVSFGWTLAGGMGGLILGGYFLDQHYKTEDRFTLAGLGLALLFLGYELWKLARHTED